VQRPGCHSRPRTSGETVEPVSQQDQDEFQVQAEQQEQQKTQIDNQVKDKGHES
jgi:hypothetical protein